MTKTALSVVFTHVASEGLPEIPGKAALSVLALSVNTLLIASPLIQEASTELRGSTKAQYKINNN